MKEKIYKIEAISVFKMTYFVKARSESDALDEYICERDNGVFVDGGQKHLEEVVSDMRELTEEQFFSEFDRENDYLADWDKELKLKAINVIDYEK